MTSRRVRGDRLSPSRFMGVDNFVVNQRNGRQGIAIDAPTEDELGLESEMNRIQRNRPDAARTRIPGRNRRAKRLCLQ